MSKYLVSPGPAITLSTGAPAGAGDEVQADPVLDKRHIDAGRLVALSTKAEPTKADLQERAKRLGIQGRTKMETDELVAAIADAEQKGGE